MNHSIVVEQIVNENFNSNTYIIFDSLKETCIIIDPGEPHAKTVLEILKAKRKVLSHIVLTHEHYDHITGVRALVDTYNPFIIASDGCFKNINNPDINLVKYFNQTPEIFYVPLHNIMVISNDLFLDNFFADETFNMILTPGHSKGGMCIGVANYLFTGDTLLGNTKIFTKFPGGNKIELRCSIDKILPLITSDTIIMPGHGRPFKLNK